MNAVAEIAVGELTELDDPGCREFQIGDGDWPLHGFIVRQGDSVYAYENYCVHVGHPLNWAPDAFLTKDRSAIICASHGAMYEIDTGLCVAGPCLGKSLRTVEATVRDGVVFVSGKPQRQRLVIVVVQKLEQFLKTWRNLVFVEADIVVRVHIHRP